MRTALLALSLVVSTAAFAENPLTGLPKQLADLHQGFINAGLCDADASNATQVYDLGQDSKLYLVQCRLFAYQGTAKVYVSSSRELDFDIVSVLDKGNKTLTSTTDLMMAQFDPKTKVLTTRSVGTGLGDCGSETKSIVGGEYTTQVRTVEIRAKYNCDGKNDQAWPVVFKQK